MTTKHKLDYPKAKAATYMMPGEHTVGASSPSGPVIALPAKPKAKKVRKQWYMVVPAISKEQANEWAIFHQNFNSAATIRYLLVGRGRKGGAK